MKRVPKSHHTERIGIRGVGAKVHRELGWEFRELTGDFGINAEIEIITDGEPTGKIIAAQIKSGLSYFAVEDATGDCLSRRTTAPEVLARSQVAGDCCPVRPRPRHCTLAARH